MNKKLAERAKQSLKALTNAKHQSQPLPLPHVSTTATTSQAAPPPPPPPLQDSLPLDVEQSVSNSHPSSSPIPAMKIKDESDVNSSAGTNHVTNRRSPTNEPDLLTTMSLHIPRKEQFSSDNSSFERPNKVPRLDAPFGAAAPIVSQHVKMEQNVPPENDATNTSQRQRPPTELSSQHPESGDSGSSDMVLENGTGPLSTSTKLDQTTAQHSDGATAAFVKNHVAPGAALSINAVSNGPPPSARRSSLNPSPTMTNSKSKKVDESSSIEENDKSFYLKHQNRALATELKSLQYAVSQLECERDERRRHCHSALHVVNDLRLVWTDILQKTGVDGNIDASSSSNSATTLTNNQDPPSTGTGNSVEWTRALQNSLLALGRADQSDQAQQPPPQHVDEGNDHADSTDRADACLAEALVAITSRANLLQEWIRLVLSTGSVPKQHAPHEDNGNSTSASLSTEQRLHDVQRELAIVAAKCAELEAQLSELASSRTEVVSRERRVRRNIYRLAAGMLTAEQVVNTLEEGDEDGDIRAAVQLEKQQLASTENHSVSGGEAMVLADGSVDDSNSLSNAASSALIDELRAKIVSLEDSVANGDCAIQELNALLLEKQQQISELSKRQLSDEDTTKLESLQSTLFQLRSSESKVGELQESLRQAKEKWAQSLGNEKSALAAVDDLISKFNKRWFDFSNGSQSTADVSLDEDGIVVPLPDDNPDIVAARKLSELQHKLNQALENVRQSEMTRDSLKVALAMNGSLQSKLDDVKAKYSALRNTTAPTPISDGGIVVAASAAVAAPKSVADADKSIAAPMEAGAATTPGAASETGKTSSTTNSNSNSSNTRNDDDSGKLEKLKAQYRRARKDLAAMTVSRDSSKTKLERAEKERDQLMESNVRLLKQMSEKDDMNAKSLSTILHLKSLTEKLEQERDALEQQMKSASQLALAARLATNAKERVSEEILKEKKGTEDRYADLDERYQTMQAELERVSGEWSEASGKMAVKESELAYAWKRSDELAAENEVKREEIRKLVDVVTKAEREANDAKEKLAKAIKSGDVTSDDLGGGATAASSSSFTVEQLQTQISVLKNRLACPVCHYRDKECIILRCRHMHCKQCVDERISNRSRKCPTCNVKFSENDVGDVWLS